MILRNKDKDLIIKIAKEQFTTPVEIWAFGSRVNGDAHDASDLDLVIKPMKKLLWDDFVTFKDMLQQSNIPILIDILVWDNIPDSFRQNILKEHEVLFESKSSLATSAA